MSKKHFSYGIDYSGNSGADAWANDLKKKRIARWESEDKTNNLTSNSGQQDTGSLSAMSRAIHNAFSKITSEAGEAGNYIAGKDGESLLDKRNRINNDIERSHKTTSSFAKTASVKLLNTLLGTGVAGDDSSPERNRYKTAGAKDPSKPTKAEKAGTVVGETLPYFNPTTTALVGGSKEADIIANRGTSTKRKVLESAGNIGSTYFNAALLKGGGKAAKGATKGILDSILGRTIKQTGVGYGLDVSHNLEEGKTKPGEILKPGLNTLLIPGMHLAGEGLGAATSKVGRKGEGALESATSRVDNGIESSATPAKAVDTSHTKSNQSPSIPETAPKAGIVNNSEEAVAGHIHPEVLNSEAGANAWTELQNATAGKRIPLPDGGMVNQPSSFPDWVPNGLRNKKTVLEVAEHMSQDTLPKPGTKASELYEVVREKLNKETGFVDANPSHLNTESKPGVTKTITYNDVVEPKASSKIATSAETSSAKVVAEEGNKILGYTPEEYAKQFDVPVDQAKEELTEFATSGGRNIKEKGIKAAFNRVFHPSRNLAPETRTSFEKNANNYVAAKVQKRIIKEELNKAAEMSGTKPTFDLAQQIEAGTAPKNSFTDGIREQLDKVRQEGIDAGADIGHLEDYVPHMWKETPAQIEALGLKARRAEILGEKGSQVNQSGARGAFTKASAEKTRFIPDYKTGIEKGLTPKYDNPIDMVAEYAENIKKARSNFALIKDLKDQGVLRIGKGGAGWKKVTAEGFPSTHNGGSYNAPAAVADMINNIYGKSDDVISEGLRKSARSSAIWQDIGLAGGIPHTPANYFTFSQIMKEITRGVGQTATLSPIQGAKTIYSPVSAFIKSFSDKATSKAIIENKGLIEEMSKRGVPLEFSDMGGKNIGDKIKDLGKWNKMFNEPTFGRFMPHLQLNTAKNTFNLLSKKMDSSAALDATAEVMKKYNGITNQMATGRSQAVQDIIGTTAFAPKYREAIVGVLNNTLKSLNPMTWKDASYSLNRQLAAGVGVTYIIYNQLNKKTTGHGMNKNPSGKALSLAIPYGSKDKDGNRKVIYVPFMPSFSTIPAAIAGAGSAAIQGDQKGMVQQAGKFLSMPIQYISQVASNKNYFGQPIVNQDDSTWDKVKKETSYGINQASPGSIQGVQKYMQLKAKGATTKNATIQAGTQALEIPIRYGQFGKESTKDASFGKGEATRGFYDTYSPLSTKRAAVSKQIKSLRADNKPNQAKRVEDEWNNSLKGKFSSVNDKYGWNDDWSKVSKNLYITTKPAKY